MFQVIVDQLLELPAGVVEVCVSDNGSSDGTHEVLARHGERLGARLVQRRNPANLGLAENVFRVVELAAGEYCWFVSSDDLVAPGGIASVLSVLSDHAGVSGACLNFRYVDDGLVDVAGAPFPPEMFPAQEGVTRFSGVEEIARGPAYLWLRSPPTSSTASAGWRRSIASGRAVSR